MKLSIIPLFASISHNAMNTTTIIICVAITDIFSIFIFFKYCFLAGLMSALFFGFEAFTAVLLSVLDTFTVALFSVFVASIIGLFTLLDELCLLFIISDFFFIFFKYVALLIYIQSFPYCIKILAKFRAFSTVYWISIFHFKFYFHYIFYLCRSVR